MRIGWKTCVKLGLTVAAVVLVVKYWSVIAGASALVLRAAAPLFIGFAIAYAVNILMSFYERHYFPGSEKKWKKVSCRPVCMLLSYLSFIGIIALVIVLIVPELTNCVKLLVVKISPFLEKMSREYGVNLKLNAMIKSFEGGSQNGAVDWQAVISKAAGWLGRGLGGAVGAVGSVISSTFSTAFHIIMGLIFSIYLLAGRDKLKEQVRRVAETYIREKYYNKLRHVIATLDESFHSFIVGQFIEAVILGSLCAIGMLILRMPYAGMIGTLIGFTALIPVAGAYIGGAVGFLMIATVSPIQALIFLVFLVVLQQMEGQLIYPRVVGASIGLPGIWVLAAVTVGGTVMGISGMLLFVPLASAAYKLVRENVNSRKPVSRAQEGETEELEKEEKEEKIDDETDS